MKKLFLTLIAVFSLSFAFSALFACGGINSVRKNDSQTETQSVTISSEDPSSESESESLSAPESQSAISSESHEQPSAESQQSETTSAPTSETSQAIDYGTVTIANLTLQEGNSATVAPVFSNAVYTETLTLTTTSNIITISGYSITAVSAGEATVTASSEHFSATFTVTVTPDYGTLTIANVSVEYGKTATITPVFSRPSMAETITYNFSGSAISINGNTVTGNTANAQVTVTATTAHHSATFIVTVGPDYGTLTIPSITLYKGFFADATPTFTTISENITYSGNASALSFDGNRITGKTTGTYTVTATTAHLSTTFNVTVKDPYATESNNVKIYEGDFESYLTTLQNNLNNFSYDDGQLTLYIGDSFFDSRYFFTDFYQRFAGKNAFTFGISSSKAVQWIWYVQKAVKYNPKTLVIHIGTNDIFDFGHSADLTTSSLQTLFDTIHTLMPSTNVYWYTIELRRASGDANGNSRAATVNSNVVSYASNKSWLTVLDSKTATSNGNTPKHELYRDTVHLTCPEGYTVLTNLLYNAGFSFSTNSKYGVIADWTTTTSQAYADSKEIPYAQGNFVYETSVDVKSYSNNAHITLNFNHNAGTRFLVWNAANNGKMIFGGAVNGIYYNYSTQNIDLDSKKTFTIAVLKTDKHAYMFIDGNLQAIYLNAPYTTWFTVGSESCSVTFSANKVYASGTTTYNNYLAKTGVSTYEAFTAIGSEIIDYKTTNTTTITTTTSNTSTQLQQVSGASGKFLFTSLVTIGSYNNNAHVVFSFNNTSSNRFLLWNAFSDGNFFFGGAANDSYMNWTYNSFNGGSKKTVQVAILVTEQHAYMFIDGVLQALNVNLTKTSETGSITVSSFYVGSEGVATTFANIHVYSSTSKQYSYYRNYPDLTSMYEVESYSGRFMFDNFTRGSRQDFSTTKSDTFGTSHNMDATGVFALSFDVVIGEYNNNAHITINLNNDANNRFLIWNSQNDGKFYYCGAFGGNYRKTSKKYASSGSRLRVTILTTQKNFVYFIVNGVLMQVYTNFSVTSLSLGSEGCVANFTCIRAFTPNALPDSHPNVYWSFVGTKDVNYYEKMSTTQVAMVDNQNK